MKFSGAIDIDKPREEVVRYFEDPKYLGNYQDGFVSKELTNGELGQPGAISKMEYTYNGREMILEETILNNNLPDHFEASYHHKHMDNDMRCRFVSLDDNSTRYEYEYEYTRINWFLPKLISILFPGMYRKQGEKWLKQFKEFVEKQ